MKMHRVLSSSLLALVLLLSGCARKESAGNASPSAPASSAKEVAPPPGSGRAIEITGNDQIKFSLTEMRAKPGETLSVTLVNIGTMPKLSMGHNWVLLKDAKNLDAFVNEAAMSPATDYIPPGQKGAVYAHTKMLGPKERDTVTFNAPQQPGRYIFLCSFPGHYQVGMKGELIVE